MSTALSHLPENWPAPGPEISEALSVSDIPSYAEMLEAAWEWAILDGLLGEVVEAILSEDDEVL